LVSTLKKQKKSLGTRESMNDSSSNRTGVPITEDGLRVESQSWEIGCKSTVIFLKLGLNKKMWILLDDTASLRWFTIVVV